MLETVIHHITEAQPASVPDVEKKRLLLVEDEKKIADWLRENLKTSSGQFYRARNLKEALAQINTKTPDLLILDLKLPDGNGVDLLKKIKNKNLLSSVYVFSVNTELRNTCIRLGVKKFYDKSKESEKIIDELKRVL